MNIRYTTVRERAAIKQAIKIYDTAKHIQAAFKAKGWTVNTAGDWKKVFIKNNIVVKIGPVNQLIAEELRWKRSKKSNKKYIARVFGRIGNMLIQRKVKVCNKSWNCDTAEEIAKKLHLEDWGHNHGHKPDGTPVFFDCVITKDMGL